MFRPVSRRALLHGAGAALALPWLETMVDAAPAGPLTLSEPPLRMAYLFVPNGVNPNHWTPPGDGEDFEITPHLKPLEGLKNDFILLENLWNAKTVGRNGHWPKVPAWLSGGYVERTSGDDLDTGGTTVDQIAAQHLGDRTPLPSLELGLEPLRTGIDTAGGGFARMYGSFLSWRDPHTPVPKEIIPQLAFDRLFRNNAARVLPTTEGTINPNLARSLQRDDTSILDLVMEDAKTAKRRGSLSDRIRLDEYFESVRSVEQRIEASMRPQKRWINKGKFPLERPAAGIPETHAEHLKLMLDIFILSFWTDTTRIGTFMIGDAQSPVDYSFLPGVKGNWHSISHHADVPAARDQYEAIINWNYEQIAYFLTRMKNLDEGGKSLLDNSMIMIGGTLKDGNRHTEENLPLILAGKGAGSGNTALRTGRRLRAPVKTPLCNLYVSMLDRMGVKVDSFGDSTGPLAGLA